MKRIFSIALALVAVVTALSIPAFAANTHDSTISNFVATTSNFDRISGRAKENSTAVYVKVKDCTYSPTRVRVFGQSSASASEENWENCTLYGGNWAPYVRCAEGTGYSIHSLVYENGWAYASLGFQSSGYVNDIITGVWSPDSANSHTDALAP